MKRYHYNFLGSTNDYAKELLRKEQVVIVTADSQSNGRGRKERIWEGEVGSNIYLSYGINHIKVPKYQTLILFQAVGCLAVIDTLEYLTKSTIFKLKYPNDVHAFDGNYFRKISGILIEHSFSGNTCKSTIIGIGVNVNQSKFSNEIAEIATSLKILGFQIELSKFYDVLIEKLDYYLDLDNSKIFELWKNRLNIVDKMVKISDSNDEWRVMDFMNDGRIKLVNENNVERIIDDGDTIRYKLD